MQTLLMNMLKINNTATETTNKDSTLYSALTNDIVSFEIFLAFFFNTGFPQANIGKKLFEVF